VRTKKEIPALAVARSTTVQSPFFPLSSLPPSLTHSLPHSLPSFRPFLSFFIPPTTLPSFLFLHPSLLSLILGRKFVNGKPGAGGSTTLSELQETDHSTALVSGSIECSTTGLGGSDPLSGYYKYCMCVPAGVSLRLFCPCVRFLLASLYFTCII
jgi:hypothetical protein